MKQRLLWKLLLINVVPVIGIIILVVWLAIDQLAANYFTELMHKYDVSPTDSHRMFVTAVHHYLIWASLAALLLAFILSFLLTRRVLRPLSQMSLITKELAVGSFSARVDITTNDEIGELAVAFNRMADSLQQIESLRRTMVGDLAHELRTPLTNLRGYLEGLNDGVVEPTSQTLQMLQKEVLHLVHLVDNLQQLARADAARAYLRKEEVELPDVIKQMVELYQHQFEKKNIHVEYRFPDGAERVYADRDKLLQAIRNMLENAWKYSPQDGWLRIVAERLPNGVQVLFTNTGSSITDEDLPFVFERFFRVDRSRSRDAGGAGLGLAIVKELIEANGGQVGASCGSGSTTVWFMLPS